MYQIICFALCCLALFANVSQAAEQPYFQSCSILKTDDFAPLAKYLGSFGSDESDPDLCFKLSKSEFIYTTFDSLYYCNQSVKFTCKEYDKGFSFHNLAVESEFYGAHGKRFVIMSYSDMNHGISSTVYFVFYLKPRKPDGMPFVLEPLIGDSQVNSDGENLCEPVDTDMEDMVGAPPDTETKIIDYKIVGERTPDFRVVFTSIHEDCHTHKRSTILNTLVFNKGSFKEIRNLLKNTK